MDYQNMNPTVASALQAARGCGTCIHLKHSVLTCVLGLCILMACSVTACGEGSTAAATNGPPARPLQTGQGTCYDANGNPIACAGTGQDGAVQAGVQRRYVDNGDGTITDTSTGLMWEKKSGDGSIHDQDNTYTWADAFDTFIAGLNAKSGFASHTDWRLPNQNELLTLIDYAGANPAVDSAFHTVCAAEHQGGCVPCGTGCPVLTCSCTKNALYWSSTTVAAYPTNAWLVSFALGVVSNDYKTGTYSVRAVRAGL